VQDRTTAANNNYKIAASCEVNRYKGYSRSSRKILYGYESTTRGTFFRVITPPFIRSHSPGSHPCLVLRCTVHDTSDYLANLGNGFDVDIEPLCLKPSSFHCIMSIHTCMYKRSMYSKIYCTTRSELNQAGKRSSARFFPGSVNVRYHVLAVLVEFVLYFIANVMSQDEHSQQIQCYM